jgi:hypothetical protein
MHVIGFMAELLRDEARNHTEYLTSSITLSHGESLDLILDASDTSNDVENFGGLLTEVHICATVTGGAAHTVIPAIWERGNEPWTIWHKKEIN